MPDAIFDDPRLARIYDDLEGERDDLDHYEEIALELGARTVLDIGCGTGALACRLAQRGLHVTGVDPALASLDVARSKPAADLVTWVHGDATTLPPLAVDLAVMTGNVAQVFVTDEEWAATLAGIRGALRTGGHLVFETRDPARRAWEEWREALTVETVATCAGRVQTWVDVIDVSLPLVTFRSVVRFLGSDDGNSEELISHSTLRFRDRAQIEASLAVAGYVVDDVRDAPDRPGREWVVVCTTAPG